MRKHTVTFCAGLTAACALMGSQAWAESGKRVAFLDGPVADKYIGGMTRSFTDTAKAAGLDVSMVQSPFDRCSRTTPLPRKSTPSSSWS